MGTAYRPSNIQSFSPMQSWEFKLFPQSSDPLRYQCWPGKGPEPTHLSVFLLHGLVVW